MSCSNLDYCGLLDAVAIALEQIKKIIEWDGIFDGVIIQLEAIFQSLVWVQPLFKASANFMGLMSAISDMVSLVAVDQDQCFRRWPGRPRLRISEVQLSKTCLSKNLLRWKLLKC